MVFLGLIVGLTVALNRPSPAQIAAERAAARAAAEARARARLLASENAMARGAESLVAASLPTRAGATAPVASAALFRRPLPAHVVVGFAPYWTMASLTPADFADTSVLAYYAVSVRGDGSLLDSGPGWVDLHSASFSAFVADARAAHDRVLLTVQSTDPATLHALLADPGATATRLAAAVEPLLRADGLDGIDVDLEGRDPSERRAFVTFMHTLSGALHAAQPGIQLVLDTYPQSAGETNGFFDVRALAPLVSQLFVMAYDMYDPATASANAPLLSPTLGLSDTQAVLEYERIVSPAKVILGVPFYGYDFTTDSATPGAAAADPVAVNYSAIAAAAHAAHWDPSSLTPYTDFRYRGHRHQTWYDDPVSIALKTALAAREHVAGVGVWALGAEGGATAMLSALDGARTPVKLPPIGAP